MTPPPSCCWRARRRGRRWRATAARRGGTCTGASPGHRTRARRPWVVPAAGQQRRQLQRRSDGLPPESIEDMCRILSFHSLQPPNRSHQPGWGQRHAGGGKGRGGWGLEEHEQSGWRTAPGTAGGSALHLTPLCPAPRFPPARFFRARQSRPCPASPVNPPNRGWPCQQRARRRSRPGGSRELRASKAPAGRA